MTWLLLFLLATPAWATTGLDQFGGVDDVTCTSASITTTPSFTITNIARTSNVVTITFTPASTAFNMFVNAPVILSGMTGAGVSLNSASDTLYRVTVKPSSTSFQFASTGSDIASAAETGTVLLAFPNVCKVNNRWYFRTPFGHPIFLQAVQATAGPDDVTDQLGVNNKTASINKYRTGSEGTSTDSGIRWKANTVYPANAAILDSNGHQETTVGGGTSGGSEPSWAQPPNTTSDNTITWTAGFGDNIWKLHWCIETIKLMQRLGFNAEGEYFAGTCHPTASGFNSGDGYMPQKVLYYDVQNGQKVGQVSARDNNSKAFGNGTKKSYAGIGTTYFGTVGQIEWFDPTDPIFATTVATEYQTAGVQANHTSKYNEYFIGIPGDDQDYMAPTRSGAAFSNYSNGVVDSPPNAISAQHFGHIAAVSAPVQVAGINARIPDFASSDKLYADTQFYAKTEWINWLQGTTDPFTSVTAIRNGSTVTYTKSGHTYIDGELISVSSCSDATFNTVAGTGATITSHTSTTFVVTLAGAGASATGCAVHTGPTYANITALNAAWASQNITSYRYGYFFGFGGRAVIDPYGVLVSYENYPNTYTNADTITDVAGWDVSTPTGQGASNSGVVPELAGFIYQFNGDPFGGKSRFRFTLPSSGSKRVTLAAGDVSSAQKQCIKVFDSDATTVLININCVPTSAGQFVDTTGAVITPGSGAWTGGHVDVTFSGTAGYIQIGETATTLDTTLCFLKVEDLPITTADFYTQYASTGTQVTGESGLTGAINGSNKHYTKTLAHGHVDPLTVQVVVDGAVVCGDDGAGPMAVTQTSTGSFTVGCTGTSINYTTGAVVIDTTVAPAVSITVNYLYGGWGGGGTGVADEDGSHAWLPSDVMYLTGATTGYVRDVNGFLFHLIKKQISILRTNMDLYQSGRMLIGISTNMAGYCNPPRAEVLEPQKAYADVIPISEQTCVGVSDLQTRLDYLATHAGDRPWLEWIATTAEADSPQANIPGQSDQNTTPACCATQALRGQWWRDYMNQIHSYVSTPFGNNQYAGIQWWSTDDSRPEIHNFGLRTLRLNSYDGVETLCRPGYDPDGYLVGKWQDGNLGTVGSVATAGLCEVGTFGDFLSGMKEGNSYWLSHLTHNTRGHNGTMNQKGVSQ